MTDYPSFDDKALLRSIHAADQGALSELYRRYGGLVYSLTLRVLHDAALAEEATQDTFLKVWHNSQRWDPQKGQFSSWLLTLARYTAIDHLRRETRQPLPHQTPVEDLHFLAADAPPIDQSDREHIRSLLSQLPQEQAHMIDLAFFGGMTHSQITAETGIPLGTVKTRLRLALQKLRSFWPEEMENKS